MIILSSDNTHNLLGCETKLKPFPYSFKPFLDANC